MNINRIILVRSLVLIAAFALIYYVRDVLPPIIISLLLFYLLSPLVDLLSNKLRIPRTFSILLAIAFAGLVIYLFFRFVIPPLAFEFRNFGQNIPGYVESARTTARTVRQWYAGFGLPVEIQNLAAQGIRSLIDNMLSFVEQSAKGLISLAGRIVQLIIIPIFTYYLLKDKDLLKQGFLRFIPDGHKSRTSRILTRANAALNNYVKGIGILCLMVGSISTLGLYLLGVKYFIILGLIAGITEAIPFIGPWIGAIPAIVIALLSSPILALEAAGLYLAIQGIENAFLVPKILGNKLSLHPIAIIVAMLVLGKLIGAWGLFFAAPIVAILRIIYEEVQAG